MALRPPPAAFHTLTLVTKSVAIDDLYRISGHSSGEPYFGKAGSYRFDDHKRAKAKRFGTCYCGFNLETAVAETLLHDELPERGKFRLSQAYFNSRNLVRFRGRHLTLADLTGVPLKVLGGDSAISTITPYRLPQLWSMAVHAHPQNLDGIYFVSRQLNDRRAVVVFDRAKASFVGSTFMPLPAAPGIAAAIAALKMTFPFP
jgi:hypothetical protein